MCCSQAGPKGPTGNEELDVRLLIHQSRAGCVIGKGGTKIKELRDVSDTFTVSTRKKSIWAPLRYDLGCSTFFWSYIRGLRTRAG